MNDSADTLRPNALRPAAAALAFCIVTVSLPGCGFIEADLTLPWSSTMRSMINDPTNPGSGKDMAFVRESDEAHLVIDYPKNLCLEWRLYFLDRQTLMKVEESVGDYYAVTRREVYDFGWSMTCTGNTVVIEKTKLPALAQIDIDMGPPKKAAHAKLGMKTADLVKAGASVETNLGDVNYTMDDAWIHVEKGQVSSLMLVKTHPEDCTAFLTFMRDNYGPPTGESSSSEALAPGLTSTTTEKVWTGTKVEVTLSDKKGGSARVCILKYQLR